MTRIKLITTFEITNNKLSINILKYTTMKTLTNSIPHLRVFKVKYIAPTNARGSRVEIKETKRYSDQKDDKVTLSYDYQIGDVLEQALQYLNEKGFEIVARGSEYDHYYILVNSWGTDYTDLKGNKVY